MSATYRIGVLLHVGFAFILGSVWQFAGAQGEKAKPEVQKWEYKRLSINDTEIAKAGDEGWELVAAYNNSSGTGTGAANLVLKRPKQ